MTVRLEMQFDDASAFAHEFEKNISKGGAFIASSEEPELRSMVEVAIDLRFCGEHRVLEAEVVHVQPGAGVAVQFLYDAAALREELGGLAEIAESSSPLPTPDIDDRVATATAGAAASDLFPDNSFDAPDASERAEVDPGATVISPRRGAAKAVAPPDIGGEDLEIDLDAGDLTDEGLAALIGDLEGDGSESTALDASVNSPSAGAEVSAPEDPLADVDDRRRSPRAAVRVPARLDSTNFSLDGRTRDISETGVLISADGSELPIGKGIQLELQNPETGERFAVSGTVSRHIEGDGTVAAVGVDFNPTEAQKELLEGFVGDAKRVEAARAEGGITGRIEELGMGNLVQMLSASSQVGTLTAQVESEEAVFAFEDGLVRYARLGALRGIKALSRMLTWDAGTFQFNSHVDALDDEDDPVPLTNALLEAARQLDEAARPGIQKFDAKTTFAVDLSVVPASELDQLQSAVLDLAMPGLTLRRILDVIPETDAGVLEAITALVEMGVLAPQEAPEG